MKSGTTSYSVIVTVKATAGGVQAQSLSLKPNNPGDYVVPVTINVNDVNEPPARPAAPTVTSTGNSDNTTLNVEWTAPDMTGKPPITDYDVQLPEEGRFNWKSHSFTGTGTSTEHHGPGGRRQLQRAGAGHERRGHWAGWSDERRPGRTSTPNCLPARPAASPRTRAAGRTSGRRSRRRTRTAPRFTTPCRVPTRTSSR